MTESEQPESMLDRAQLTALVRELGEDGPPLIARFLDEMAATVEDLRLAIGHEDRELALRLVHSLKSLCATFGARGVTDAGRRVEAALHDGAGFESLAGPIEALTRAEASAKRELKRWLAASA